MSTPAPSNSSSRTRTFSLRTRWMIAFLLAGAIPLVLFGFLTLKIQRDGLEHAEQIHEFAVIDHALDAVSNNLHEASEATHRVGMVLTDPGLPDGPAKIALASELMANAASLARVSIYLPDGTLVDSIVRKNDAAAPEGPAKLPTVEIPTGQDGVWLPVEYASDTALLRYVEPIRREGKVFAWVIATLRPDALSSQMQEISRDRFENRADGLLLLDETGRVFASGAEKSSPLGVGKMVAQQDIFSVAHVTPKEFDRPLAVSAQFQSSGEAMVGTVRTVPERKWAVVARRASASVFASLAQTRKSLLMAGGGFLLLAVLISVVLVSRTVRPIYSLIRLAKAYGQREFKTRSDVRTGDEIELLGNQMVDMATAIESTEAEVERRIKVEANLSRFMPASVAKGIAEGNKSLALGGERRTVTVLFADVASFTPFAEGTDPERVVAFLNELFGVLTEVVFRHEGTVDKFIGDCVMAVFGAPAPQDDHVARAITAAEDMHRFVESSAAKWKARYGLEPRLAIGINTGEALVGNLGSEARMEYTCVGDVVNVAARLEGMAQPGQTLVTGEVVNVVGDTFDFNSLGDHPVRGKKQSLALYELAT